MSGCGCGQPVIVNAPTPARVDVETLLLCDVLADGTVAGRVLVEPVYDTNTGDRIATRTVDPVTGAAYVVQGTLQQCEPPSCVTCETLALCDQAPGAALPTSTATLTVAAITPGTAGTPVLNYGAPVPVDPAQAQAFFTGGTANPPAGGANEHAYAVGAVTLAPDCGDLDPAGSSVLTISARIDNQGPNAACGLWGRFALWDGATLITPPAVANLGTLTTPPGYQPGTVQTFTRAGVVVPNSVILAGNLYVELNVQVGQDTTPDGGGCTPNAPGGQSFALDQFAITAEPVPVTGCTAAGGALTRFLRTLCRNCQGAIVSTTDTELDGTTPYTVAGTVAACDTSAASGRQVVERCGCDQTASGIVRYIELWSVDPDGEGDPQLLGTYVDGDFTQPYTPVAPVDCPASGPEEVAAPIVLGHICYDDGTGAIRTAAVVRCAGCDDTTVRYVDVETGDEVTAPAPVPCPADPACASPTTPLTSVGLCLADGTPIAVTVVRDCDGVTTSEGWINLTTGAWTAGATPAGTVACGDSQSIQISGTFCDVDAAGTVVGLVLVEYSYAADGTIASVRLVDAVTGATYTPTGTVTVCPAGVDVPEQDAVILCDVLADGTVTQFLRDYRRDELGAIVAHSDYTLDGATYTPTGTVGVCAEPCLSCETATLCDSEAPPVTVPAAATNTSVAASATALGVGHRPLAAGGAALWSGGVLTFPGEAAAPADGGDQTQVYRGVGAVLAAEAPECFTGDTVTVTVSVRLARDSAGFGYTGRFRILDGTTPVFTADLGASVGTYTATAVVPVAHLNAGQVRYELWAETFQTAPRTVTADQFAATVEFPGCPVPFQRTTCRDCTGEIVSVTDTTFTGTPYTVLGEPGPCPGPDVTTCLDCETLLLCDDGANDPATLRGLTVSSGTLSNGVTWSTRGTAAATNSTVDNADGAWWNSVYSFPNATTGPQRWTFSTPVVVEFSAYIHYWAAGTPGVDNTVQLPAGVEVVSLPTGFHFDPVTNRLTVDSTADPSCTNLTAPNRAASARFRTTSAVTSLQLSYLGARIANCGRFGNWAYGALEVVPSGQFLRTICRSCDGTVASVTDTTLDGTTPYTPAGAVGQCSGSSSGDDSAGPQVATELLCDIADGEVQTYAPTSTAVVPPVAVTEPPISSNAPGFMVDPTPLFPAGGSVVVPTWGTDPGGFRNNAIEGRVTSAGPTPCGTPQNVRVTVTLRATNTGSSNADLGNPEAGLTLRNGAAVIATANVANTPLNGAQTFSVNAVVPWADVIAGNVSWYWWARTYQAPNQHKTFTVDQYAVTIVDDVALPGCGDSAVTPFLRHYTPDEVTGSASYFDTDLDGAAYTPAGTVSVCPSTGTGSSETCGDTEVVQLCDLVYTPQPPMAVPASSFALAGNVTAAGGQFVYSGGNAPITGVASRAVTGLLDGAAYELRFDAGWNGGGLPAGTGDAVYRAEVLDGATVIATRDRNVSNGSVSGGPVTAEAPLLFTAPASGSVTVRFTDVSTGTNNRDLVIRPQTVQTQALQVTATPFLRALAFDCTGAVTGTTDTGLDGTTPYTLQGAAGTCSTADESGVAAGGLEVETWPLCVVDNATGDVVQSIRREVVYDAAGAVSEARYVDAADGTPVTLAGGTHIAVCPGPEPCQSCETISLCDSTPQAVTLTSTSIDPTPYENIAGNRGEVDPATAQTVFDGGTGTVPASAIGGEHLFAAGRLAFPGGCLPCGGEDTPVTISGTLRVRNDGPNAAEAIYGRFSLWNGALNITPGTGLLSGGLAVGASFTATFGPLTVPAGDIAAGNVVVEWNVEANGDTGTGKAWTVDQYALTAEAAAAGCGTTFLRTICRDCDGATVSTTDTLDGATPYAPVGAVAPCQSAECGSSGSSSEATGKQLVERCGCDDTTGDGIGDVRYIELWAVDPEGTEAPALVGTWLDGDFEQPYTPVSPVDCPGDDGTSTGAVVRTGVQRHTGDSIILLSQLHPGLQSVTLAVLAGQGTVTTDDGTQTIPAGTAVTWSVTREGDDALGTWTGGSSGTGSDVLITYTYRD